MNLVKSLSELKEENLELVGAKGIKVKKFLEANLPLPPGFFITSNTFERFLEGADLKEDIKEVLSEMDPKNESEVKLVSKVINNMIMGTSMPKEILQNMNDAYGKISTDLLHDIHKEGEGAPVLVRSYDMQGNLREVNLARGIGSINEKVKKSWADLFTREEILGRIERGEEPSKISLCIIVQKAIDADKSGIVETVDLKKNNTEDCVIKARWGLEPLKEEINPVYDIFKVNKGEFTLAEENIDVKHSMVTLDLSSGKLKDVYLSAETGKKPVLEDFEAMAIAKHGADIENYFGAPQRVRWMIDDTDIYILGTEDIREEPVENVREEPRQPLPEPHEEEDLKVTIREASDEQESVTDMPVWGSKEAVRPEKKGKMPIEKEGKGGEIPIEKEEIEQKSAEELKPEREEVPQEYVEEPESLEELIEKKEPENLEELIQEEIPLGSEEVQTQKELENAEEAPLDQKNYIEDEEVGGIGDVDDLLKSGHDTDIKTLEEVSDVKGEPFYETAEPQEAVSREGSSLVTATKVLVDVENPANIGNLFTHIDGVGLFREELIFPVLMKHPRAFIESGESDKFVNVLSKEVERVARILRPLPVRFRFSSMGSEEYLNLEEGEKFERSERNPALGIRGCSRFLDKDHLKEFRLSLSALKKVREELGLENVEAVIPFARTLEEFENVTNVMKDNGLERGKNLKVWLSVDVPSNVIMADKFAEHVDGFLVDVGTLTRYLGAQEKGADATEMIQRSIKHMLEVAKDHEIDISIYKKNFENSPGLLKFIVSEGIHSVTVSPSAIEETRKGLATEERTLLLDKVRSDEQSD